MPKPKYVVQVDPKGRLHNNVLMTTHDVHATGLRPKSKVRQYVFPIHEPVGAPPFMVINNTLVDISLLRIIEGKDAEAMADLDDQIKGLQVLRAELIRSLKGRMRQARVDDFHTPTEVAPGPDGV